MNSDRPGPARRVALALDALRHGWPINFDGAFALLPAETGFGEKLTAYSAYVPALESAYLVGSKVVHELVTNWPRYEEVFAPQKP